MKTKKIEIRVTEDMKNDISVRAEKLGLSVSALMIMAYTSYLRQLEPSKIYLARENGAEV